MDIWGKLFGDEDVIKKSVDGIYNGIDKSFFTAEEKAEYFLRLLEAYHPFKLAQRFIALLFVVPYILSFMVALGSFLIGLYLNEKNFIDGSIALIDFANKYLGIPVSVIVAFYFAGGALNSLKGVKR